MEHRWSRRKPVVINVSLHQRNIYQIRCKTRDLSQDGMFVLTQSHPKQNNGTLRIEFEISHNGAKKQYRLPAMVVHQCEDGIGLMFIHNHDKDFSLSHKMLMKHLQEDASNNTASPAMHRKEH